MADERSPVRHESRDTGLPCRKSSRQSAKERQKPPPAPGRAALGWDGSRRWLKPLPLQKEFESLRRFVEGYGLTMEKLARMARVLEHHPAGKRKGVLESLRSLAEKRRIPHGRLTQLAETLAYEPELERQIKMLRNAPHPALQPAQTTRRGWRSMAARAQDSIGGVQDSRKGR